MKNEKGITLIALIITVIIMVILAAISISAAYRDKIVDLSINGIQNYVKAANNEKDMYKKVENLLNENTSRNNEKSREEENVEDENTIWETVETKSNGGNDATITIKSYEETELISETDVLYTTVRDSGKFVSSQYLKVHYNQSTYNWEITALRNLKYKYNNEDNYKYLNEGSIMTFKYSETVNYTFYPAKDFKLIIKENYMENLYTYSTGGFDASLQLDKYNNNTLESSENILYTKVSGQNNSVKSQLIEVYYGPWTVIALKDLCYKEKNSEEKYYLTKGEKITFPYNTSINYEFYEYEVQEES